MFAAFRDQPAFAATSVGALWGRGELLRSMEPFNLGGHMIRKVTFEETTWGEVPAKFEAGTQPIAEAVRRRGRPLFFLSGYGSDGAPIGFEETPVLGKPCTPDRLKRMIDAVMSSQGC